MRVLFLLVLVLAGRQGVFAQFASPVKDSIQSVFLNEKRNIEITLPDHYQHDTTRYDVWYVLDGEWDAFTFTKIAAYEAAIGFMPPVIIVSVPNRYANGFNYRDRDLTPTKTADVDSSGGASLFLAFLEKELLPYIDKNYRTNESGLCGGSFGGLFTMYTLLERPSLFRFYALSDPAFHYDNQYIPKLAASRLHSLHVASTVLNIGGRSGLSYDYMGRDVMDSLLRTTAPKGLHWHSALYDNETHGSVTFKSTYDGLRYAYLGYSARTARFHLTGGVVLKDRPVRLFLYTDNADMHYTMDGSEPTRSSPRVNEFLIISDPSRLRAKSFSASGRYDRDIPVTLKSGDYISPKKSTSKTKAATKLTMKSKPIAGLLNGVVNVPNDGYYIFQLTPSEGTRLYFNDSLLVAYNPSSGHARETIILPLRKGDYSLRLEHFSRNPNDPALNFGFYYSENGQDDWWRNPLLRQ